VSVSIDTKIVNYDRPIMLTLTARPYTVNDSGLIDIPRFEGNAGDDLAHDETLHNEHRPEPDYFSIWLIGFSAWARS